MGGRLLDWLGAGVASSLPDPVTDMPSRIVTGSTAFYWATDTKHLFVYDPAGGPAWFDIDMAAITAVSTESIQDMIATFLSAGTGITLTYNDAGNLLTIAGTVTQYTDEMAQDAVAAMIAAGTDTGLTIVYNDAGNAIAFTITVATASDIWGGTLDTAFITPKRLKDWRTPVSVTDAATITLDGSLGANFYVTLGGNRILANPTNFNPGQFGVIHVTQDGTGTRTLTFGANWKFGSVSLNSNVLTTTAGAVDAIHYYVRTDGTITCFIVSNLTGSPAKLTLDNLSNVAISSPANGDVLTYNTATGKWKNAVATGGAGSTTNPSVVQYAAAAGNVGSVILGAAPTAGNLLVGIGTHWSGATVNGGWLQLYNVNGSNDGMIIATHLVGAGESATQSPWAIGNGCNIAVFEVKDFLESMFYAYNAAGDSSTTSRAVSVGTARAGALILGLASCDSSNVAPTSITNAGVVGTTQTGVGTGGGNRQSTPFYTTGVAKGSLTLTANYAGSVINYLELVAITNDK